jgi:hypothetical protein
MREFMSKDGKEEASSSDESEDPGSGGCKRRHTYIAKLQDVTLQMAGDEPDAQRHNGEPAIVYADGDAIDASDCQLSFEELSKAHSEFRRRSD